MRFKHYDQLRTFIQVARHHSLSTAADELGLTKAALSYQIRQLEASLGFEVFDRHARGISLTEKGRDLFFSAGQMFEQVEQKITELNESVDRTLTIGVTTYFSSRWLSPRLMDFMRLYPDIRLRIQPMINLADFQGEGVDIAIRWGRGRWKDCVTEKFLSCPAVPTGNRDAYQQVVEKGLKGALAESTLLRDRQDSVAWSEWYQLAGMPPKMRADTMTIPDPNMRVQAVLDGQGISLHDALVAQEVENGQLFYLSPVRLEEYGYFLAYQPQARNNPDVVSFIEWITDIADNT